MKQYNLIRYEKRKGIPAKKELTPTQEKVKSEIKTKPSQLEEKSK